MIGIENIKLAIVAIIAIVNNIKLTGRPLAGVLLSLGKVMNIKFKAIKEEIKDIDTKERRELIDLIVRQGFSLAKAENVIKAIGEGQKFGGIAKELLK
jgi:hypothetical protein